MRSMVVCGLLLAGCGDPPAMNPDLGVADLLAPTDMTAATVPLGGACTADTQCLEGKTPVCWKKTLFNSPSKLATKDGYCSSKCVDDNDCGGDGVCRDYGTSGKWCFRYCKHPADCRSTGYACFIGDYCFPDGNLDCDPTAPSGRCTTAPVSNPGGCLRGAWGTGNKGYCYDGCQVGPGSCRAGQQCIVFDNRNIKDVDGKLLGDTFIGPVCNTISNPNPIGTVCKSATSSQRYIDDCIDGAECYIAPYFPSGDNLCKQLCTGVTAVDGGAPPCPVGQTCTDVWMLFGTTYPAGLCL